MNDNINYNIGVVTGECVTRLSELKKYTITDLFLDKYISDGNLVSDGVDYNISTENNVIYYLGGIKYNDVILSGSTVSTYTFTSLGYSSPDFFLSGTIRSGSRFLFIPNPSQPGQAP